MTQEHMTDPGDRQELIAGFKNALLQAGEKPEVMAYMLRPENLTKLSDKRLAELTRRYQEYGAAARSVEEEIKAFNREVADAQESILKAVENERFVALREILDARKKRRS